jgi:hypothetical protein
MITHEKPGKTFADVFDSLLTDWRRLGVFAILVATTVGAGCLVFWLTLTLLHVRPSQLQISALGGQISLQTTTANGTEYLMVIHPQGWEETPISVRKNQKVSFEAEGQVCIDGFSLFKVAQLMNELEQHYKDDQRMKDDRSKPADAQPVPEQFYSTDVKETLSACLKSLWTGPEGFNADGKATDDLICPPHFDPRPEEFRARPADHFRDPQYGGLVDKDFRGRTKNKLMPHQPYGRLIGAVLRQNEKDQKLPPGAIFDIGKSTPDPIPMPDDGRLYLNVNDVVDRNQLFGPRTLADDSAYFFSDNIGFFLVKITVTD